MNRLATFSLVAVAIFAFSKTTLAQATSNPAAKRYSDSGHLPWVVWKLFLGDSSGKRYSVVADFRTEVEMQAAAKELAAAEGNARHWNYLAGKRPPTALKRKIVNPVPSRPSPAIPSLVGRTAQGQIGGLKATIRFRKGTFVITGGIEGTGTWEQIENSIGLRTETSEYQGKMDGKTIAGVRFFVHDKRPFERWRFELEDGVAATPQSQRPAESPQAATSLEGTTWLYKSDAGIRWEYTLGPQNTFTSVYVLPGGKAGGNDNMVKSWSQNGHSIKMQSTKPGGWSWTFEGTLEDDTINGRFRNTSGDVSEWTLRRKR